jgi:carbonic anhydrase
MTLLASFLASLSLFLAIPLVYAGTNAPHWSYGGEDGPDHWGELADAYRMCSEGRNQSPVDIAADLNAELPELVFDYHSSPLREINNGHSIQQNVEPGSFLIVPDRGLHHELKQFHFHSPSEHTVAGKSYAMEMHFVHVGEDGMLVVVGILIEEGAEHPVVNKLWAFMPEHAGETSEQPIGIEETDLLPPTREYYTYSGSLTTPPCSEGVAWIVLKNPIELSAEQIERFKERVGPITNRPIQPQNSRLILE